MAVVNYTLQSYTTETGNQTIIGVNPNHRTSVHIIGGASDDIDLHVQLRDGGTRIVHTATIAAASTYVEIPGPIVGIGIDINTNVSNAISLEVRTALR